MTYMYEGWVPHFVVDNSVIAMIHFVYRMATNYQRGVAYEYKAKKQLEEDGYTVIRAAGSHGPFDLIAFRGAEPVRCIQIKRTKAKGGVKQLLGKFTPINNSVIEQRPYVHEMWVWYGGRWYTSGEA